MVFAAAANFANDTSETRFYISGPRAASSVSAKNRFAAPLLRRFFNSGRKVLTENAGKFLCDGNGSMKDDTNNKDPVHTTDFQKNDIPTCGAISK